MVLSIAIFGHIADYVSKSINDDIKYFDSCEI